MARAEFLFLGTGASAGIPMIGCHCRVCTSLDGHNHRLRPSGLLTINGKKLLIDSGPDLRMQALKYEMEHLDGMLLTHSHFDHIAGIDELRIYYLRTRKPFPVLLSHGTYLELKKRYDYLFMKKSDSRALSAQLEFCVLQEQMGSTEFCGIPLQYVLYEQAGMPVMGYRFGPFAYISDIRSYQDSIFSILAGVEILVVSVLKTEPSVMHFNLEEGIAFSRKMGAKTTFFTHIGHELDHAETNALLPKGVQLAYDGLKLEFGYGY